MLLTWSSILFLERLVQVKKYIHALDISSCGLGLETPYSLGKTLGILRLWINHDYGLNFNSQSLILYREEGSLYGGSAMVLRRKSCGAFMCRMRTCSRTLKLVFGNNGLYQSFLVVKKCCHRIGAAFLVMGEVFIQYLDYAKSFEKPLAEIPITRSERLVLDTVKKMNSYRWMEAGSNIRYWKYKC